MRPVIYSMVVSLDGAVEAPDGSFEWAYPDEELHRHFNDVDANEVDTHLYGRVMWEQMAAYWPAAAHDAGLPPWEREYAAIWDRAEKVVVSSTLESVGLGARLVRGADLLEEVRRLKARLGKGISVGGVQLAVSLARVGLVDEFRLYKAPIVLGGGRPMFDGIGTSLPLRLLETRTFASGVVLLRYGLR